MNKSPPRFRFCQRGMVSIIAAILLIAAVIFVLGQTFGIIGNTSSANTSQGESVAAFFLAESGVERAQAEIKAAIDGSTYSATYCTTTLATTPAQSLGGGTFQYTPAPYCTCNGLNCAPPNCTECNVTVKGTVGSATRSIRVQVSTANTQGTDACSATPTLPPLTTTKANAAVFTNLAYRAKESTACISTGSNDNAVIASCWVNWTGHAPVSCAPASNGWDIQTGGTNNVSGMGVVTDALVTKGSIYTIDQTFTGTTKRHYVQIGVVFYPKDTGGGTGKVDWTGSYGVGGDTSNTIKLDGVVSPGWNCGKLNNTAINDPAVAANSNTLLYGFSSSSPDTTSGLSGITFGITPMHLQLSMSGTTVDSNTGGGSSDFYLYSQIWYAFNSAYYASGTINSGATITGSIGNQFQAHTDNVATPTSLTLDEDLDAWESLTSGDTIYSADGTTALGKLESLKTGTAGKKDATYGYTGSKLNNNTNVTTRTTALRVTSGTALNGDTIISTDTPSPIWYGTVGAPSGNIYQLNQPGFAVAGTTLYAARKTIDFTGAPSMGSLVTGEAAALTSIQGTGGFSSTTVNGSITDTTLTLAGGASATFYAGDVLFGANVKPNTTVVTGGTSNTFTVTPSQTASGTIVARTGLISQTTNSITVSRPTRISGATAVCGGVCALLARKPAPNGPNPTTNVSDATTFTLSGAVPGYDWSSGFACLSGVDSSLIKNLGAVTAKRTSWTEVVQ